MTPEAYLPNIELAAEMAYAEHPYREMAALAMRDGNIAYAETTVALGKETANKAGRAYLQGLLHLLGEEITAEAYEVDNQDAELQLAKGVRLNKAEVLHCINNSVDAKSAGSNPGGRLWSLMSKMYVERDANGITISQLWVGADKRKIMLPDMIVALRQFDEQKMLNPQVVPSEVLGRQWGNKTVSNLRLFLDHKLAELKDRAAGSA